MQPIRTGYGYLYADGIERAGDSDLREDDNDGGYSGEHEPSAALYSPLYSCPRRLSRVTFTSIQTPRASLFLYAFSLAYLNEMEYNYIA